jgi:hypothetical protein
MTYRLRIDNVLTCNVGQDSVVMDTVRGVYYSLNETGTFIWNMLKENASLDIIKDRLLDEFEVTPNQCQADIAQLIKELVSLEILQWQDI